MARPVGFIFIPSDRDLVWNYLARKVLEEPILVERIFTETDIYRFDPDKLNTVLERKLHGSFLEMDVRNRSSDGKWDYFFVRRDLSEKHRRTPNGFWKEVGEVVPINAVFLGCIIGFKRSFVFVQGTEDDPGASTRWEMEEYSLNQERHLLRNDDNPEMNNYVACRVYMENESPSDCTVDSAYRRDAEEAGNDDKSMEVDSSGVRK
ncbi:hypothetical protein GW17_00003970 [Ensete ventricosum]|nr:hypothetical protein GW17_00003970 [Ensete ventricosum]